MTTSLAFAQFYDSWFDHLHHLVQQLASFSATSASGGPPLVAEENDERIHLIDKVMSHHEDYYRAKSLAAEKDPLNVFVSPWATTLERSLHWITGWRPTTAFHLIYTESSVLFESRIVDILRGIRTGDLGDLSPTQFRRVSELQCDTVKEENAITEELSEWQDSACDMMGPRADINEKIGRLVSIIRKADDLRLRTLRSVVGLLSPQQAIEFLIASAELLVGIRGWGLNHDRPRRR
ncbi:protein DOG1-like 4 [Gastrolobium bilobum]|uniref:protein DOG1-like 4 n=1 Tax=Gastrolobium bilobum TaxID=150636 RepID=UPI002AAFE7B2|nr:protein DOG1-like 4 [Gastrolobium bilobum]